ncbi:MAG: hypothetical protein LBC59_07025 [Chitinispirillales bacterium]|nr:hypothetical protein [Chitinispirillales bacterium]
MKRQTFLLLAALIAVSAAAQTKYVAVVETELDAQSNASANLSKADVREITAVLRNEARNILPSGKYKIMTTESVIAQGGAKLEDCAEENCVVSLGTKIGADYIVRGIISSFGTKLSLTIETYETEDGTLVGSARAVSERPEELLEKAAEICGDMYKTFVGETAAERKAPVPSGGTGHEPAPGRRKAKNGVTLGCVYGDAVALHAGFAQTRPIVGETASFVWEAGMWIGEYYNNDRGPYAGYEDGWFIGMNVPLLFQVDVSVFSLETGVQLDMLQKFGSYEALVFNAGFVAGGGLSFGENRAWRCFYRFNSGTGYYSQMIGIRRSF